MERATVEFESNEELVLRRSYEGLSAGTHVTFIKSIGEWAVGTDLQIKEIATVLWHGEEFDVAIEDLVKPRKRPESVGPNKEPKKPRTTKDRLVVAENRRQRRASDPIVVAKRMAYEQRAGNGT